jgi:hypothetical protein
MSRMVSPSSSLAGLSDLATQDDDDDDDDNEAQEAEFVALCQSDPMLSNATDAAVEAALTDDEKATRAAGRHGRLREAAEAALAKMAALSEEEKALPWNQVRGEGLSSPRQTRGPRATIGRPERFDRPRGARRRRAPIDRGGAPSVSARVDAPGRSGFGRCCCCGGAKPEATHHRVVVVARDAARLTRATPPCAVRPTTTTARPPTQLRRRHPEGELEHYSQEAIAAREAVRDDPRVCKNLEQWWKSASMFDDRDKDMTLDKAECVCRRVCAARCPSPRRSGLPRSVSTTTRTRRSTRPSACGVCGRVRRAVSVVAPLGVLSRSVTVVTFRVGSRGGLGRARRAFASPSVSSRYERFYIRLLRLVDDGEDDDEDALDTAQEKEAFAADFELDAGADGVVSREEFLNSVFQMARVM